MSLPSLSPGSSILSNAANTATSLGNLILVVPNIIGGLSKTKGYQPQNPPNPDGTPSSQKQSPAFLFDYEGEQTVEVTADITDHFIEDNTAIQDQIALRPTKITTKGFISELNDIPPNFLQPLKEIAQKLTSVGSYAPGLSQTALLAYNEAFFAYQTAVNLANAAVGAWSSLNGGGSPLFLGTEFGINNFPILKNLRSRQQIAFGTFYGYFFTRTLFTVQTPWAVFGNMAIERLHPIQSEDSQTFTTFEITFKQIKTVQEAARQKQSAVSQGRLANQAQPPSSNGFSTPPSDISLTDGLTGPTSASFPTMFA